MPKKQRGLEELLAEEKKLKAEIKKAKDAERKKVQQHREKQIKVIGRYVLEQHEKSGTVDQLKSELDGHLKSDAERKLFGLEPLVKQKKESQEPDRAPDAALSGKPAG